MNRRQWLFADRAGCQLLADNTVMLTVDGRQVVFRVVKFGHDALQPLHRLRCDLQGLARRTERGDLFG